MSGLLKGEGALLLIRTKVPLPRRLLFRWATIILAGPAAWACCARALGILCWRRRPSAPSPYTFYKNPDRVPELPARHGPAPPTLVDVANISSPTARPMKIYKSPPLKNRFPHVPGTRPRPAWMRVMWPRWAREAIDVLMSAHGASSLRRDQPAAAHVGAILKTAGPPCRYFPPEIGRGSLRPRAGGH